MKTKSILTVLSSVFFTACLFTKTNNNELKTPITNMNLFPEEGLTDPHVWVENDKVYLFGGHDKSWDTKTSWLMDRWEIRSTTNLIDWKKESDILPTDTYIGDKPNCWAGDIVKNNNKYYWYFSNRNIDTGVMVSDTPTGPFKDLLKKPLLPANIIKGHPYDPAIYEENGVYTMFFSAGHYYAVTLGDDMMSLADTPQPIVVKTKEGEPKWTADKSTVFKRGDIYYLVWGGQYAMSKTLLGPYIYEGHFLAGGHNDVFKWKNQWYVVTENKDLGLFYRGISLKPLNFNSDGTVNVPKDDYDFPEKERIWKFNNSSMGWKPISGTSCVWDKTKLKGIITGSSVIESSMWLLDNLEKKGAITIRLKNKSAATKAKIQIATFKQDKKYWKNMDIDWDNELSIEFDISANDKEYKEYTVDIKSKLKDKVFLKSVRLNPALNVEVGSWEIDYISIHE